MVPELLNLKNIVVHVRIQCTRTTRFVWVVFWFSVHMAHCVTVLVDKLVYDIIPVFGIRQADSL